MPATTRDDLRNVAIVAHVDHGKTTLVDAMLWQCGAFSTHQAEEGSVNERVMDSMDLEREKGITILAKNTAVKHRVDGRDADHQHHRHPGARRLRRRGRARACRWSTASSCWSTPARARCRRPGSCCARRCRPSCPSSWSSTRWTGRTPASPRSSTRPTSCSSTSTPTEDQIEFPIVYCSAKAGRASLSRPADGGMPDEPGPRAAVPDHPRRGPGAGVRRRRRRCRRTSPTSTPRPTSAGSRCAGCTRATIRKGQTVAWCRTDGTVERVKITELLMTEALERVPAESAGPGDIIAIAGIPEITIGETLADADDPRPLPVITIDEPSISMTVGINTSPLAGRERQEAHRPAGARTGSTPSWSATCRSGCCRPSDRTPGRCRAAASCSWRSSSRSCGARASSSPSASPRSSPGRSTASCTSRWSG